MCYVGKSWSMFVCVWSHPCWPKYKRTLASTFPKLYPPTFPLHILPIPTLWPIVVWVLHFHPHHHPPPSDSDSLCSFGCHFHITKMSSRIRCYTTTERTNGPTPVDIMSEGWRFYKHNSQQPENLSSSPFGSSFTECDEGICSMKDAKTEAATKPRTQFRDCLSLWGGGNIRKSLHFRQNQQHWRRQLKRVTFCATTFPYIHATSENERQSDEHKYFI